MSYKKPVLDEIYVRINYQEDVILESKFFDIVPLFKEIGLTEVEIHQTLVERSKKSVSEEIFKPRIRCWDKERLLLAQITKDTVIVNQTKKYLGWESFLKLTNNTLMALSKTGIEGQYKSVELKTIDKFTVPKEDFTIDKWLNCSGGVIPTWYKGVSMNADIILGKGDFDIDGSNRQFSARFRKLENHYDIIMESGFREPAPGTQKLEDILNRLHDESNEFFESVITDSVRNDIMDGVA